MKTTPITFSIILVTTAVLGSGSRPDSHHHNQTHHHETSNNTTQHEVPSRKPDITVQAKGIVCSFCAQGIIQLFTDHNAIEAINFSEDFNLIYLYTLPNETITDEEIETLVTDSGYDISTIIRE